MADRRRRAAAAVAIALSVAAPVLVTGCGGPPDKADFVAKMRESLGDLDAGLASQNIDPETGDALITTFLECQYDSLKDDEDLLNKVYDDPGDTEIGAQLDTKSRQCVDDFSSAMAAAAGPTTTTTPSGDVTPTEETPPTLTVPPPSDIVPTSDDVTTVPGT